LFQKCLDQAVAQLADEFRGVYSPETVARYVYESYARLGYRSMVGPNFLPTIIARFAHDRLWAAAQTDGHIEKALPELLFICRHDAGRSQIAAAVAHHLSNGWVVDDPAGAPLWAVRQIRYELFHRVWGLLETLVPSANLIALH
jgi:hypothetical protein